MKHIYIYLLIVGSLTSIYPRDWFVSPTGIVGAAGTITAPITLQDAGNRAGPGDIVYLRAGRYVPKNNYTPLLQYIKAGGSDANTPITFRNYPPDNAPPELVPYQGNDNYEGSGSWALIKVYTSPVTPTVIPKFLIFDGLVLKGKNTMMMSGEFINFENQQGRYCEDVNRNGLLTDDGCPWNCPDVDLDNIPDGCENVRYNGQGLLVTGPFAWDPEIKALIPRHNFPNGANPYAIPHHITVRNCVVKEFPGAGMSFQRADYITVENCEVANNCWYTIFGSSGINFYQMLPYEGTNPQYNDSEYRIKVINNVVYGNTLKVRNQNLPVRYDGNGIIIDDFIHAQDYVPGNIYTNPNRGNWQYGKYNGRTLVANNVIFGNGGAGIKVYSSQFTDVYNNTLYNNGIGNYSEDRNDPNKVGHPVQHSIYVQEIINEQTKVKLMDGKHRVYNNIAFNNVGYPNEGITPQALAFFVSPENENYNNLVLDPSFISYPNVNPSDAATPILITNIKNQLKLNSNSMAINYGLPRAEVPMDLLRYYRDVLPDAGAYETPSVCVERILVGSATATVPAGESSNIGPTARKVYRAQKSITYQGVYVTQAGAVVSTEISACNMTPAAGRLDQSQAAFEQSDFDAVAHESQLAYPNPVHGGTLYFGMMSSTFTLTSVSGLTVLSGTNTDQLHTEGLDKGLYILILDGQVQKIIIE